MAIKFKSYTDIAVDGQVISVGNTLAVAAAPGVTAVNKYIVSLPVATRFDFWGFETNQDWDDPVTLTTTYQNVGPGPRTITDVKVVTYWKDGMDRTMRQRAAYTQNSASPTDYYDNALSAANRGI